MQGIKSFYYLFKEYFQIHPSLFHILDILVKDCLLPITPLRLYLTPYYLGSWTT